MNLLKLELEVLQKLDQAGQLIVQAAGQKPIGELSNDELIAGVNLLMQGVSRDIGLRNYDEYDATRLTGVLQRYYSRFSLHEVKLAFELAIMGKLDEYLTKGSIEHYQQFSILYITKILRAYEQYRGKTMLAVSGLLPEAKKELSEEEKVKIDQDFFEMIQREFVAYRDDLKAPEFLVTLPVMRFLAKHELLDEEVEMTEVEQRQAFDEMQSSKRVHELDKQRELGEFKQGIIGHYTMIFMRNKADIKCIRLAFDKLVDQGKDIFTLTQQKDEN
jgi:hypothetical protein